jgi:hypothetical protein
MQCENPSSSETSNLNLTCYNHRWQFCWCGCPEDALLFDVLIENLGVDHFEPPAANMPQ